MKPLLALLAFLPAACLAAADGVRIVGADPDGTLAYAAGQVRRLRFPSNDAPAFTLRVDPALPPRQSRVIRNHHGITVVGDTPREVLQGVYRLEDLLRDNQLPTASNQQPATNVFTRLFSPRIAHSGRAVGEYPDDHLDEIARAGMDAVVVYLADPPDVTRTGRRDLSAFARRARRHGLDVYLYLDRWKRPFDVNPKDPAAESFYGDLFGSVVRAAPEIKGFVLVGESVPFPSRDAGVSGYGWQPKAPSAKAANGFWPVSEWTQLLDIALRATRRYRPDFEILFWTYSWAKAPAADRLALLESIPTNVTLHVTFELGDPSVLRNGRGTRLDDYSVTVPGPSGVFRSEAAVARRRGLRLTAMTNTGGRTWDYGGTPFVPAFAQWTERFRKVREAHSAYGLAGLMDSHAFGFAPNPVAELAKVAFTAESTDADIDEALVRYAKRTFGDGADDALAAFKDWSEAFRYHPADALDQYGCLRIGPTYPLLFFAEKVPAPPPGYCAANKRPGRWAYLFDTAGFNGMDRRETQVALDWAERELAGWQAGNAHLSRALKANPPSDPAAADRLVGLGRYCEATARTLRNLKRYQLLGPDAAAEDLNAVIDDEAENVRALLPFVERDAALGFEPNMRRITGPDMLRWKLSQLDMRKNARGPHSPASGN